MRAGRILGPAIAAALIATAPAAAAPRTVLVSERAVAPDTVRATYRYGPLVAGAGQNLIMLGPVTIEKPPLDIYVTRVRPNLVGPDGRPPAVEKVHMHHAVMLNMSRQDASAPELPERFYGFAEEKTIGTMPPGYGYPAKASDVWAVNYMLHNGTPQNETVFIEYEVDYVPALTPTGQRMKVARPLWIDVHNGSAYPVFDVKRGSGRGGVFTYPDDARDPYRGGRRLNEWRVPRDITLLATAGHVHPGGLWTDLEVERGGRRAHLFRSEARYFDPNGPVSWDMAMTYTPQDWRVGLRQGDVLRVKTGYETQRASWYESMGLNLVFYAEEPGPDPFVTPPATRGEPTHGHLPEAGNHGGQAIPGAPDQTRWPEIATADNRVGIGVFLYLPGDASAQDGFRGVPAVNPGQVLRFGNLDASAQIFHSVTTCRAPCNRSTGVSYPLADGEGDFDSGSLGYGPGGFTGAAQRAEWNTPKDLQPGTYTYFCRIHPFMRGAFRVRGKRPTPKPGTPRRATPRRARLRLLTRRARADRRGRLRLRARCAGGSGACRGTLTLASRRARGRALTLAKVRFAVRRGATRTLRVKLRRRARALLRKRRRVTAQALVRQRGLRPSLQVVTLRRR